MSLIVAMIFSLPFLWEHPCDAESHRPKSQIGRQTPYFSKQALKMISHENKMESRLSAPRDSIAPFAVLNKLIIAYGLHFASVLSLCLHFSEHYSLTLGSETYILCILYNIGKNIPNYADGKGWNSWAKAAEKGEPLGTSKLYSFPYGIQEKSIIMHSDGLHLPQKPCRGGLFFRLKGALEAAQVEKNEILCIIANRILQM